MEVYEAIQKRKSTRNYTEEEVKKEQIEEVLEAGRLAPYAGLAQAGREDFRQFFVIKRGSETDEKLMDLFMAPLLIVAVEHGGRPAREHAALGYVMENMWLKATEMGLGFKLCSGVSDVKDQAALKKLLGLPEEETYAFEGCSLGYAVSDVHREERREVPKMQVRYMA